ncbi:hypothetical protein PTT_14816, partial [Pyrenophora teres f. teres 0-1]
MHSSTIAAILAFTAGMSANAAPANPRPEVLAELGHIAVVPTIKDQATDDLFNSLTARASGSLRVGKSFEGEHEGDATSIVADVITIDQAVQGSQLNAKRDAQRGRSFGKVLKGAGDGVGTLFDLVTIGGIIGGQPAQKREAQRSRGRVFGNIIEGVGGAIGGAANLLTIHEAVGGQPAQKREAQRSRGR